MRSITAILSIIIAILIFVFITQPKYAEVLSVRAEIDEYKSATEKYIAFNAKVQELRLKRDSVKVSERDRLSMLIPSSIEDTRILVDIETMATRNNLLLGSVKTEGDDIDVESLSQGSQTAGGADAKTTGEELRTSEITFEVVGMYADFKNFLRELETSLTLMEVIEIEFTKDESDFDTFGLKVRTYALPIKNS